MRAPRYRAVLPGPRNGNNRVFDGQQVFPLGRPGLSFENQFAPQREDNYTFRVRLSNEVFIMSENIWKSLDSARKALRTVSPVNPPVLRVLQPYVPPFPYGRACKCGHRAIYMVPGVYWCGWCAAKL